MKTAICLLTALLAVALAGTASAAGDPMLGEWVPSAATLAAQPDGPNDMLVTAAANGYDMRQGTKGFPAAAMTVHYVLDGKPHTYLSVPAGVDAPPGHPTNTCKRTTPREISCMLDGEGHPSTHTTVTLSADGKTLTFAYVPGDTEVWVRP